MTLLLAMALGCGADLALGCSAAPAGERPSGRAIAAQEPIRRTRPQLVAGGRLDATRYGSPHPARVAISVGDQTWVATPAGVLRFDARLWRAPAHARPRGVLDVAAGLPASAVNDLHRISATEVLIATDRGLVRVDHRGRIKGRTLLQGQRVTALSRGLIGTWQGLYRQGSVAPVVGSAALAITDLCDCAGAVFVATQGQGLWRLDRRGLRPLAGLGGGRISRLACGAHGRVWAATLDGLYRVDGDRARAAGSWRRHVTAVAVRGDDVLFGTFGEGVHRLRHGRSTKLTAEGRIALLAPGPGGALLVGSERRLEVIAADRRRQQVPLQGPPAAPITALALEGTVLWIGTFDRGLVRFDGQRFVGWPVFDQRITALAFDGRGRLWVGTANGLGRVQSGRTVRVSDPRGWLGRHISALRREGDRIWAAAYPGLVRIDAGSGGASFHYVAEGLAGPTVYGLALAGARVWIGTQQGLTLLGSDGSARSLTDLGGVLPDNWINDVRVDGETVSVLTLAAGLLQLGPRHTRVIASDLMTSPGVLLALRGRLLWGTNSAGLVVDEGRRLVSYGPAQGLSSATVTALVFDATRDLLWVGGTAGVARIARAGELIGREPEKEE